MTSGIHTLAASANITRADGRSAPRAGVVFDDLSIGQNLKLRVLKQLDQQRYEVAFGNRRHVVESRVQLQVGTQVQARVEAKGDRLELRYLSTELRVADEELTEDEASLATPEGELPAPTWLNELAMQYRVSMSAQAQAMIAHLASQAAEPQLMARAGLFAHKVGTSITPRDIEALYRVLSGGNLAAVSSTPVAMDTSTESIDLGRELADVMDSAAQSLTDAGIQALGDASSEDYAQQDGRRALRLLNLQDEGSVTWRYGTLPLLVGGQLIELDLVMFRERQPTNARGGLKRLVMTLETTHFGRVRVEARALDDRLLVKMQAASADAIETLSAYGADVQAAIERLGWQVDEVAYEIEAHAGLAAQAVIDHVLSAGSVDREL